MALSDSEQACEDVLRNLKVSRLTFSVKETQYSAYITIRKKFTQQGRNLEDMKSFSTCQNFEKLTMENSMLKLKLVETETEREDLLNENKNLHEAMESLEQKYVERNEFKDENRALKSDLEVVNKDIQCTKKIVKQKDKEVYDLQKENSRLKEEIQLVQSDYSNLKSKVNREAKQAEKKNKKSEKKEFLNVLKSESEQDDLPCKYCDKIVSSEDEFNRHLLLHHTNCSSTQTNNEVLIDKKIQVKTSDFTTEKNTETVEDVTIKFENYPGNYCGHIISSKNCLEEHVVKCCGSHGQTFMQNSKTKV